MVANCRQAGSHNILAQSPISSWEDFFNAGVSGGVGILIMYSSACIHGQIVNPCCLRPSHVSLLLIAYPVSHPSFSSSRAQLVVRVDMLLAASHPVEGDGGIDGGSGGSPDYALYEERVCLGTDLPSSSPAKQAAVAP